MPHLVDLCCSAGGATRGYQMAGWTVTGIDVEPQPNYIGDHFIYADVLELTPDDLAGFDAAAASPPCQRYSDLAKRNGNAHEHPDLIPQVRELLIASGLPYVIENVEGAPLIDPIMLCGTMFPELRVLRHRLFESNVALTASPHKAHPLVFTMDKRKAHYGTLDQDTAFVSVNGGGNCSVANKRAAMGITWGMTGRECNEAIPPAFTEHLGRQLLEAMGHQCVRKVDVEVLDDMPEFKPVRFPDCVPVAAPKRSRASDPPTQAQLDAIDALPKGPPTQVIRPPQSRFRLRDESAAAPKEQT